MKTRDRVILTFLTIGIWVLIGTIWLKPNSVNAHDDGHTHYEYAEEGHSHTCYVDGEYATCD
jgi:hypothetical protein